MKCCSFSVGFLSTSETEDREKERDREKKPWKLFFDISRFDLKITKSDVKVQFCANLECSDYMKKTMHKHFLVNPKLIGAQ